MADVQTVKPSDSEIVLLKKAAMLLKRSRKVKADAEKEEEAAKETLRRYLTQSRKIDVETLKIGEMVLIENICMIEVKPRNKFDEKDFLSKQPAVHAAFKREFPTVYYNPLVA